ncbi:hypothetical protein [Soonwooa sp.]|uniref:hypothetical protein n=1 Tax=Soonwooa sp. TaxID=1938592 RepID=UPI0026202CB9|nr:hypothetical protein [Soonwooa sp.]
MSIFNFWKKNKKKESDFQKENTEENLLNLESKTDFKNGEFEFLICGEIKLDSESWEKILSPNTIDTKKVLRNGWPYFQVGSDEYSYSFEEVGIQMTFNEEMEFQKAKRIADEII